MRAKSEKVKSKNAMNRVILGTLALILAFTSCNKDEVKDENVIAVEEQQVELEKKYFLGGEVPVKIEDDGTYSLGGSDTRVFENQLSDSPDSFNEKPAPDEGLTRLGLGGGVRKWTNSTVAYVIKGLSSSVRSELKKSMDEWTNKTNVRFVKRTNQSNYVTISSSGSNSNSGYATLGMSGSRGFIKLGTRATAVVIIHEIGHTLGYIHEQNRSDRDDYIVVNFGNIQNNAKDQFYKSSSASLVTNKLDIKSTMMYSSYTFSKNGKPTITDLNGKILPRRQARLSNLDISGTNSLYRPSGTTGGDTDSCKNVKEWSSSKRYSVGDRVTYKGYLYERDFARWIFIKRC